MRSNIIVDKNPLFDKCPDCRELGVLHRSRARNTKERIIKSTTFFKLYRCKKCGWRGYRSTLTITRQSVKVLFYYLLLAVFVGFIVRFVLTKFIH